MSRQPETRFSVKAQAFLRSKGIWCFKVHGSGMQRSGLPDLIGTWKGLFLGIELKMPGNVPSPIQRLRRIEIMRAGALSAVSYSVEHLHELVEDLENYHTPGEPEQDHTCLWWITPDRQGRIR